MNEQQLIEDGKKSFEYYIKEIEKDFDFNKVYEVMKLLNWAWSVAPQTMAIPTPSLIKTEAIKLLRNSYDTGNTCSTGGLMAGWDENMMFLSFILEEASV